MERLVQELTDHIIGFLHDSPDDWQARIDLCSSIPAVHELRWARFLEAYATSPHLIRHVRQLDVDYIYKPTRLSTETFLAVCTFPFRHLRGVSFILNYPTSSDALALQQFLSSPPLCRVRIYCSNGELSAFWQIWVRCSSSLKHLELTGPFRAADQFLRIPSSSSIRLESLNLQQQVGEGLHDWLMHPLCPFDFSALKALRIGTNTHLLRSPKFAPALGTLEALELEPDDNQPTIDLSSFPSLEFLRIYDSGWPWLFTTLSTVTLQPHPQDY
ncbi:hypothetical protein C8R44DRAFT_798256, partial [Mycena epipterygia]